jgi:hypothetical protein
MLGFYQNGFVVIDLDTIRQNPDLEDPLILVRYVEWILRHEIGHALQFRALQRHGLHSSEEFAEWFAKEYSCADPSLASELPKTPSNSQPSSARAGENTGKS